jgi:hypothetical protein
MMSADGWASVCEIWKRKHVGMNVSEARHLHALEDETADAGFHYEWFRERGQVRGQCMRRNIKE